MSSRISSYSDLYAIKSGLIMTIERGYSAEKNFYTLINAYKGIGCPSNIIGVDFSGDENILIDDDLAQKVRSITDSMGLGLTVHAGEINNVGNVYQAVEKFSADRIGHGVAALKDMKLLQMLKNRNICLELCPISNILTGALKVDELGNIRILRDLNIPFVICADNPCIQGSTQRDDYIIVSKIIGDEFLEGEMLKNQHKFSFIRGV